MSAPSIPNLLSTRGAARGRGARGRGARTTRPYLNPADYEAQATMRFTRRHDAAIQRTDGDANDSRMSAVILGYLNDEYAQYFNPSPIRRQPIINRGTYVRTTAIDQLVYTFLKKNDGIPKQIISLGAGTDTRYFRLREDERHKDLIYHEIDFKDVTIKKMRTIARCGEIAPPNIKEAEEMLHDESQGTFYSRNYNIHGLDLRDLPNMMWLPCLSRTIPTLLISECCLCYLEPQVASDVINYFASQIPHLGIIIYEPTNPNTSFGQVMKQNLAARNLTMPTLSIWGSLDAQKDRLRDAGFLQGQNAADIGWLWNRWVHPSEKERLNKIEILDEVEEWELLATHYLVAWAFRDLDGSGCFDEWARLCPGPGSRPGYS